MGADDRWLDKAQRPGVGESRAPGAALIFAAPVRDDSPIAHPQSPTTNKKSTGDAT
jgi:hypothetical protein